MGYVMECKNVTYTYPLADEPSIRNVSLNIEEGKFYGIVGENGSGKTTLCAILRGFAPSFYQGDIQGEVLVYGKPIGEYGGELATKIGYVFQNPSPRSAASRRPYLRKWPTAWKISAFP